MPTDIKIYLLPFISALIGWVTNYLAIKMLFHPRKPVHLLFFKIQGIFPKRQKLLAEKLGNVVANELLSAEEIKSSLLGGSNLEKSMEIISTHIDKFLKSKLVESFPMAAMFLSDSVIEKMKKTLLDEIEKILPELIDSFLNSDNDSLDVKGIVENKVSSFSTDKLEEILFSILKKEFRLIEILGGVLGFIIGIVQILLVVL